VRNHDGGVVLVGSKQGGGPLGYNGSDMKQPWLYTFVL